MQTGRLTLTLGIALLSSAAWARDPAPPPIVTNERLIDGDRYLELDQSRRVEIPPILQSLQLSVPQQRRIRRLLQTAHTGADAQQAMEVYVAIRHVLSPRQQRALTARDTGAGG